ncbi:hypothetical protein BDZ89DRAFT_1133811 [Hymenopellis radicata]|nr:hypothetical protein BDZ89DRAFT_1149053 [Hymenopellis radicata]KAF9028190.1 hypothetical protein BDZ89DRAFT_1133811 [Hymenopellis radicata]
MYLDRPYVTTVGWGASSQLQQYGPPFQAYRKVLHDELATQKEEAMRGFNLTARFAVNIIPLLGFLPEWLPGAGFQGKAKAWTAMVLKPFTYTKEAVLRVLTSPRPFLIGISPEDEALSSRLGLAIDFILLRPCRIE